jgi:hypothetical protein
MGIALVGPADSMAGCWDMQKVEVHIGQEGDMVQVAEERSLVVEGEVAQRVVRVGRRGSAERHNPAGAAAGPVAVPSPAVPEAVVDTVVDTRSCRT